MMVLFLTALGGGVGAVARFLVDHQISRLTPGRLPWGTSLINVSGSFLLGFLTGWWVFHTGDPTVKQVLGTGFLGGYTTFSTACVEAARLARADRRVAAAARVFGVLILGVAAATLGFALAAL